MKTTRSKSHKLNRKSRKSMKTRKSMKSRKSMKKVRKGSQKAGGCGCNAVKGNGSVYGAGLYWPNSLAK